jgi:hypothetical protein
MLTFAAAAAKDEPSENRNVEPRLDGFVAVGALGAGKYRETARKSIDEDVEKAAEGETEDEGADSDKSQIVRN